MRYLDLKDEYGTEYIVEPRHAIREGMKWCPECARYKDIDEFHMNRRAVDGKQALCPPCHKEVYVTSRTYERGTK